MRTVQMTMEPDFVARVDEAARRLGLTRSAFARHALTTVLDQIHVQELERRHRVGYQLNPASRGEFDRWAAEQVWPD